MAPIDFMGSVFGTRSLDWTYEFPDVVWQYDDYADGCSHGYQRGGIRGLRDLDGCNSHAAISSISTLPLIRPILAYTLITSIIGGLQMFDVPQILTNGQGNPDRTSMTLIMFLNSHLKSKNYGMARCIICLPVYCQRYPVLLCIPYDK